MIAAHGATLTVTASEIVVEFSPLLAALRGATPGVERREAQRISVRDISDLQVTPPSSVIGGAAVLSTANGPQRIVFSPNQAAEAQAFAEAVAAARKGEAPMNTPAVPGLDFVAFDVETANSDWGSICQLGAARFIDGRLTETSSWLVKPPAGIDEFQPDNIAIHGITPDQVSDCPRVAEVLGELVDFVGELPMVAHNAQFDFTALSRAAAASDVAAPTFRFACTLLLARSLKLGFENNRLPVLARGLGIALNKHHDATADAVACGEIMAALARRAGFQGSLVDFYHQSAFTLGEVEPTRVYPVLRDRSGAGVALQRKKMGLISAQQAEAKVSAAKAAAQPAEPKKQSAPWSRVSTPDEIPEPNAEASPDSPFFSQHVTLSGDFDPFDKGQLWHAIAELGGTIGKNVTKKTTIVVCGEWATKTSKQKRAEELIEKGQEIALWTSDELFTALGLDPQAAAVEQPPF